MLIPENVTKKIDSLGRITLPKGLRDRMLLDENSEIEISTAVIDGKKCICLSELGQTDAEATQAAITLLRNQGYTVSLDKENGDSVYVNDLKILARNFYKVVEVNLAEDTYYEVRVDGKEKVIYKSLKKWVDVFAEKGVYPRDRERFLAFFDRNNVDYWRRIYYRRLIDNKWRWVCMEVVPTDDVEIAVLVVRDVEDYIADWRDQFESGENK